MIYPYKVTEYYLTCRNRSKSQLFEKLTEHSNIFVTQPRLIFRLIGKNGSGILFSELEITYSKAELNIYFFGLLKRGWFIKFA